MLGCDHSSFLHFKTSIFHLTEWSFSPPPAKDLRARMRQVSHLLFSSHLLYLGSGVQTISINIFMMMLCCPKCQLNSYILSLPPSSYLLSPSIPSFLHLRQFYISQASPKLINHFVASQVFELLMLVIPVSLGAHKAFMRVVSFT